METIKHDEIAGLLGISPKTFSFFCARLNMPQHFPYRKSKGEKKSYLREDIERWIAVTNPLAKLREIQANAKPRLTESTYKPRAQYRRENQEEKPQKLDHKTLLIKMFLSGKFDTKYRQTVRKLAIEQARQHPPERKIVHLSAVYGLD